MGSPERNILSQIYVTEADRLERQIARRIGNRSVARDLLHDVFLRCWERPAAIPGNTLAFVVRSARNAAIDYLRREKVRNLHMSQSQAADVTYASDPVFEELSVEQSKAVVQKAVAALPETTRRLFLMNRAQGLSFQQIAAICGMSERNVAKHMAKAVACCAKALENERSE